MTLTNRLTLFFLAAQVVVLAAFSVTLYVLARCHLYDQLNAHLSTTMDTLVALAEIEPDGLDWEPELRRLPAHWEGDPPVWAIFDETGTRIDGSHSPVNTLAEFASPGPTPDRETHRVEWGGSDWRVAKQTLVFPDPGAIRSRPGRERHQTLVFVTAWPVAPVQSELRSLEWGLAGVSAVVWILSGLAARWACRRALSPVSRMAEAAKRISTDALGDRLPVPAARDELHELAGSFNDLLSRVQDSFERQRRFTGEASHQLRTPLTAMLGQMEVALRRDRDPDEYRRVLTTAVAQAERLRRIVESLLFLARADAEARHPDLERVDLVPWLHDHLTESWSEHPRFADLRVEVPTGESATVYALPTLLGQAVDNLLDNAFKYSDPGSHVSVVIARQEDAIIFAVEDRGPGIAAEDAARLFEPFFRSSEARRSGIAGVGLGLAIAARIVNVFGGRIGVEGRPGGGSRFLVRFPLLNTSSAC
jgi:heavy metal sensor kinase